MSSLRVFFVGGLISYRALFNWIQPGMYVATMLGSPLFQILFFTYLGRYAGSQDDAFYIVGNAMQVAAMAGIYGMTMGIANERQYGTLQPLLATPANRLAIFSGRALPFIANGIAVSVFGFAVSWLLLDFRPADWGWTASIPGFGLLADDFPGHPLRKDYEIDYGYVVVHHLRAGAEGQAEQEYVPPHVARAEAIGDGRGNGAG